MNQSPPVINFQRVGSISNAHVGRDFEKVVANIFVEQGYPVQPNHRIALGHGNRTKLHNFDLGCDRPPIIIECKSHRWTAGGNSPSAKMTVWNEAMYYFHLAPSSYKKCLCVLKDHHPKGRGSLASHYLRLHENLVPPGVEIWEFDLELSKSDVLYSADVAALGSRGVA